MTQLQYECICLDIVETNQPGYVLRQQLADAFNNK